MPADTKLYLYLDPGRLLSTSAHTWDPSLYGGWVPHQMAAFLWPSGPWFWTCERLGLEDWIAHRLWLGTILFLGGLGIVKLVKALGMPLKAMCVGARVPTVAVHPPLRQPHVGDAAAVGRGGLDGAVDHAQRPAWRVARPGSADPRRLHRTRRSTPRRSPWCCPGRCCGWRSSIRRTGSRCAASVPLPPASASWPSPRRRGGS